MERSLSRIAVPRDELNVDLPAHVFLQIPFGLIAEALAGLRGIHSVERHFGPFAAVRHIQEEA